MNNLICTKCRNSKSIDSFSLNKKRKKGYQTWCKECIKDYDHLRHQRDKEKIALRKAIERKKRVEENNFLLFEYFKDKKCKICGETNQLLFEFHHRNSKEKEYNISEIMYTKIWKNIQKEIKKCDILCCSCHRLLTMKERKTIRYNLYIKSVK